MISNLVRSIIKRLSIVTAFFILINCSAQNIEWNTNTIEAYNSIVLLQTKKADSILKIEALENPKNYLVYSLQSKSEFLKIFLTEDKEIHDAFQQKYELVKEQLEELEDSIPAKKTLLANLEMEQAFVHLKFGETYSGGWKLWKANKLTKQNNKAHPNYSINKKNTALMNAISGSVPSGYQWLSKLFGFEGSITQGDTLLKNYADSITKPEVDILRVFYQLYFTHNDSMAIALSDLLTNTPLNNFAKCLVNSQTRNGEAVIQNAKTFHSNNKDIDINYINFLLGKALIQSNNSEAIYYLSQYIKSNKNNIHDAKAYWLMAEQSYLNNKEETFKLYVDSIAQLESNENEGDNFIKDLIDNDYSPNRLITKAKHAYDYGNYELADSIIDLCDTSSLSIDLKCEWHYRKARILHAIGDFHSAFYFYEGCLKFETENDYYFQPASCYFLASFESDLKKVKSYIEKMNDFGEYAYKKSYDQKAKALLNRLTN